MIYIYAMDYVLKSLKYDFLGKIRPLYDHFLPKGRINDQSRINTTHLITLPIMEAQNSFFVRIVNFFGLFYGNFGI